jgi:hypothetical protein
MEGPTTFCLCLVHKVSCKEINFSQDLGDVYQMAKRQENKSTIRFSAKLFRPKATENIGSWTILTLPKNASAKLPSRGMTMVEGTINGFPFRAALEPNGKGSHWLRVNKAMHDAAGADAGDTVTVEITRAGEEPETRLPMDLRKALAAAPLAQALWTDITPIARRVEEFRHVESEHGTLTEEVTGKFQRQFCLPYSGRPEKEERAERFAGGLQAKLAAFQHGTHARNDVGLAFDLGKQVRLKAGEILNEGGSTHGLLAGWARLPLSHWRTA